MKVLSFVAFLGVVAAVLAQPPEEFIVIDDQVNENDIDPAQIQELEDGGSPSKYLTTLNAEEAQKGFAGVADRLEAYDAAFQKDGSFGFSANNDAVNETDRAKRQITSINYCPHVNYLLSWFPYSSIEFCYVPWPHWQGITYAGCTQTSCACNPWRTGRCLPDCHRRHKILAFCYNFRYRRWTWRWVVRNLARACTCSCR